MDRNSTATMEEISDLTRELERLKNDLRQIRGDVTTLGGDAMRTARASFTETTKTTANKAKAIADAAEVQIAAHPFIAIGTALALGVLLGERLARKD
jgi:ElaB/YqjD/DUF883 family membrane-anchored ribosome-binding protein